MYSVKGQFAQVGTSSRQRTHANSAPLVSSLVAEHSCAMLALAKLLFVLSLSQEAASQMGLRSPLHVVA